MIVVSNCFLITKPRCSPLTLVLTGLNKFLMVIAERMDGDLLYTAVANSRPFITYGLGEAFDALARFYRYAIFIVPESESIYFCP